MKYSYLLLFFLHRYAFVMNYSTFWADLYTHPIEEGINICYTIEIIFKTTKVLNAE